MAEYPTNINLRVTQQMREKFYRRCSRNHEVPASVLRRFIQDYIAGKIKYNLEHTQ